ncbi:DUF4254 domain-containing protein [Legionella sp. CNM-4043-24]|uniref:DUF4254 domain-containing protein n=1 Tax=Legionella sp. CNM-4043-24 TaxID=3421646 RepID=UPI00403B27E1
MNVLTHPRSIATLHDDCILRWNAHGISQSHDDFFALVEENHAFNYQLWNAEDRARREDMGFEFVYRAKREIDHCNQQRNNRMETMDEWLFSRLNPASPDTCPVHSETPGMMIDRLSILALKSYHMGVQATRHDVDESHRQTCQQKLQTIHAQRQQLLDCLEQLLEEVKLGKRTFRVYHQFKMYNDPRLNPQLYTKNSEAVPGRIEN